MIRNKLILLIFLCNPCSSFSQVSNLIKGIVSEKNTKGIREPISGAQIQWIGDKNGVSTNAEGYFELLKSSKSNQLLVRCIGFESDTIEVDQEQFLQILLTSKTTLKEMAVQYERKSSEISFIDPWKTTTMNEKELFKSACCNLSESFETNPSVDVSYSDAVTGTKQIQLLGLATQYTQLTQEMTPGARGIAAQLGYAYTPGTWIKSIQVTKGIGSVVNGFESIAGQINTELHQPDGPEKLIVNGYDGAGGRSEVNLVSQQKLSPNFSQGILLHVSKNWYGTDHNHDGFLDNPIGVQLNGMYRFKFENKKGFMIQGGFRAVDDNKIAGQNNKTTDTLYSTKLNSNRKEFWIKTGYVFPKKIYRSIGLQLQSSWQNIDANLGLNHYQGNQNSNYLNLIYQSIIVNSNHKFKTGFSFLNDGYDEQTKTNLDTLFLLKRTDWIPGTFFEYTADFRTNLTLVAGLRADYHSLFGAFITPRLHIKYSPWKDLVLRASIGKGQRTASLLGENFQLLSSNRVFQLPAHLISNQSKSFELENIQPERAWNMGGSLTWNFELNYRKALFTTDYFYTTFENQLIVDRFQSAYTIQFYNLKNSSYSHSFQMQLDAEPLKHLNVRIAYRYIKSGFVYDNQFNMQPLIAKHRAFLNVSYQTYGFWNFDYTLQWTGEKALPKLANTDGTSLNIYSSPYFIHHVQVSKFFNKKATNAFYFGAENLFNFMQENAIVNAANPWAKNFDASAIWGPIFGTMWYAGIRWRF